MLQPAQNIRHGQRTQNFNATTSLFNYGTLGAAYNSNLPCTWLALIRPTGAGEGNFGYFASKCISGSATGMRWLVTHNGGAPYIFWGISSGNTGPGQSAPSGSITYNKWVWVAATYAGGLAASNIKLYQGYNGLTEVRSYPSPVDGSGSINLDSSNSFLIGNRDGGDRTFAGDMALVVRWDAVLDQSHLNEAIKNGPLSVRPDEILFCWAGGQEVSKHRFTPTAITARALGRPRKYALNKITVAPWAVEISGGGGQTITASGIASEEAFGAHTISAGAVSVVCSGIATEEAFGTAVVSQGGVNLICSGIATEEAFGSHTVAPGAVTVTCSGIATAEAFGDAFVSTGGSLIAASGIASLEAFGSHTLVPGAVSIICSGIASDEAFGTTVLAVGGQFLTASAIDSAEAFGSHTVVPGGVTIVCSGISSLESFGASIVTGGVVLQLSGGVLWSLPSENRLLSPFSRSGGLQ